MDLEKLSFGGGQVAARPGRIPPTLPQGLDRRRLQAREQLLETLLASVDVMLWAYDWRTRCLLYCSPAWGRTLGRPDEPESLADWLACVHPEDRDLVRAGLRDVLDKGAAGPREYRIVRGDGQVRWLSDRCYGGAPDDCGRPGIIVGIAEDITERKQLECELQHLARTDELTRVGNRRHFFECARHEFRLARQKGTPLAFLLLDVDDFKRINDGHGHPAGDLVLQCLAQCCTATLRGGDLFGRIGGEEFAVLFPRCRPEQALRIAERLQRAIGELVLPVGAAGLRISVSQGLASLAPGDADLAALHARADEAMYRAKHQGKNRIVQA